MPLNPKAPIPLYQQFKTEVERMIASGQWPPGSAIPTEMDLIKRYDISRTTVRLALDALTREGRIVRQRGRGTFVAPPAKAQPAAPLTGFAEELSQRGLEPVTTVLEYKQTPAPQRVSATLGLTPGTTVLHIRRLVSVVGHPVFVEDSYYRADLAAVLTQHAMQVQVRPPYLVLEAAGLSPFEGEQWIEAVAIPDEYIRPLRAMPGTPGLAVYRTTRDQSGVPMEDTRVYYRGDRYRYGMKLQKGPQGG